MDKSPEIPTNEGIPPAPKIKVTPSNGSRMQPPPETGRPAAAVLEGNGQDISAEEVAAATGEGIPEEQGEQQHMPEELSDEDLDEMQIFDPELRKQAKDKYREESVLFRNPEENIDIIMQKAKADGISPDTIRQTLKSFGHSPEKINKILTQERIAELEKREGEEELTDDQKEVTQKAKHAADTFKQVQEGKLTPEEGLARVQGLMEEEEQAQKGRVADPGYTTEKLEASWKKWARGGKWTAFFILITYIYLLKMATAGATKAGGGGGREQ